MRLILVNELATTLDTNMILFPFLLAVPTDMGGSTLWALPNGLTSTHTSII